MNMKMSNSLLPQRGATLFIAMIMLLLMTILTITVFQMGKSNLQIVGNMQQRNEALSAAQSVIEQALSSTLFFSSPSAVFVSPCSSANTQCVDTNGDGVADVTVTLTPNPTCTKVQTIKNSALDLSKSDDLGCAVGSQQSFGVVGTTNGDSMCADSLWEINAVATDSVTQAQAQVTQGVSVRVSTDSTSASCP